MKLCKNLVLSLMALALALLCICALPQTAQAASESDLTFTLNETGDGYIVSSCSKYASGELVIPATHNGLPVTAIGNSAFSGCSSLTGITIPDSVTTIGYSVFSDCSNLTYNTYSNGNYLGNETNPYVVLVEVTTTTLRSYKIHPDTKIIYSFAFSSCTNLTSITIPDGATCIGASAFYNCTSLTSITIPEGVITIGNGAFKDCSSLASVIIPDSVISIGRSAFQNCYMLTTMTIGNGVAIIDEWAFRNCYKLITVTIPDSVTTIGNSAFYYCHSLTSAIIGDKVTSIGENAFDNCYRLINLTLGDSVTTIGKHAFYKCTSLTSVNIPDSVTTIGDCAFQYCSQLSSVTVGSGMTSIGMCVFSDCPGLTTVALQDSVTYIADEAFYGCDNLETVIYCGTNGKWEAMDRTTGNDALDAAALQLHNYVSGVCSLCGQLESGAKAVAISAPEGAVYRGDTVTVTVSTDMIEHCAAGGFLFDFDSDIFEYVSGEALVSGFSSAGISTANGKIAGYFMDGDETLEGDVFQITLRVKEDADFTDYTISGTPSFSARIDGILETVPCEAFGATVTVACRHEFGDWIGIDETWHKHICTICSYEETLYIEYSVIFQYADGTVISEATYHYGDTVVVPQAAPQVPNSYFTGWDKEIAVCTGDVVYTAIFVEYIPGDMDGDGTLTYNDAVYLLLNNMFGDANYPLSNAPADIDGNGKVNQEDAIYLLLHTLFGEEFYPLKKE